MLCSLQYAVQEYDWYSLREYCDKFYPNKSFKNDSARKKFVKQKKLNLQPDEHNTPGVAVRSG